ncbi:MAG: RHS repeat-associated core domain-containing protein, partial [Pirellulaceae bacterium]
DALGRVSQYRYDSNGNQTAAINHDGSVIETMYDQNGNPVWSKSATGSIVTREYDESGGLVKETDALGHATNFERDQVGRVLSRSSEFVDDNGQVSVEGIQYQYDLAGQQTAVVGVDGVPTRTTYDSFGKIATSVDQFGQVTEYDYEGQQAPRRLTLIDDTKVFFEYDAFDRVVAITDQGGFKTEYRYDAAGNMIGLQPAQADGEIDGNPGVLREYDVLGNVSAEIDANGNRTEFTYDAISRLISTQLPNGGIITTEYDAVGRPTRQIDPTGSEARYVYRERDGVTIIQRGDGFSSTEVRDADGRLIQIEESGGAVTRYDYDHGGNLTTVVDANGNTSQYDYDAYGNLTEKIDPDGNITRYVFNAQGLRTAVIHADGARDEFEYRTDGRLKQSRTAEGRTEVIEYDERHRVASRTYGDGSAVTYDYDSRDNPIAISTDAGVTVLKYDALERLVERQEPGSPPVRYEYDHHGNRTLIDVDGRRTLFEFNSLNLTSSITQPDGSRYDFSYDLAGRLVRIDHPNGYAQTYTFGQDGELQALSVFDDDGVLIADSVYSYGRNGYISTISSLSGTERSMIYDANGQLVSFEILGDEISINEHYEYDGRGNVVSFQRNGVLTERTYNNRNQLIRVTQGATQTDYEYDQDGNLVLKASDDFRVEYAWDDFGRLIEVKKQTGPDQQVTELQYDPNGLLISKSSDGISQSYVYDHSLENSQVVESHTSGDTRRTDYGPGGVLGHSDDSGRVTYFNDHVGTINRVVDDEEGLHSRELSPFGSRLDVGLEFDIPFGFAGQLEIDEVDLVNMRARYYSPSDMRFVSADPFEGFPSLPLSLNEYQYAYNNPQTFTDPSGEVVPILVALGVFLGVAAGLRKVGTANWGTAGHDVEYLGLQSGFGGGVTVIVGGDVKASGGIVVSKQPYKLGDKNDYDVGGGFTLAGAGSLGLAVQFVGVVGSFDVSLKSNVVSQKLRAILLTGPYILGQGTVALGEGKSYAPKLVMGAAIGSASGYSFGLNAGAELELQLGVSFYTRTEPIAEASAAKLRSIINSGLGKAKAELDKIYERLEAEYNKL